MSVLGRSPYNDSDVVQLETSDSSSDATASCSATCSSDNGYSSMSDNIVSQRLVSSAAPSKRYLWLCALTCCIPHYWRMISVLIEPFSILLLERIKIS